METSESLFEILDFTAVSDWERTVSVLEEAIAEWDFTRPSRVSVPVPLPGRHSSVIWSSVGAQGSLSLSCTPGSSTTVGQQLAQLQSLFCSGNNGPVLESISCSANSVKSSVTAYQNLCFLPMTYATSTAPIVAFLTDLHRCTGLSELILLYPTDSGNHQSKVCLY